MRHALLITLFALAVCAEILVAQPAINFLPDQTSLLISVVNFKGLERDSHRVDVYAAMPYQLLQFVSANDKFGAQYSLLITIRDSSGNKLTEKKLDRKIVERDYNVSRGSTGKADITQTLFAMPPGVYLVEALCLDALSKREFKYSRKATIPDYDKLPVSASSIVLASSLEEREGTMVITPHLTDNVSNLTDGFFVFFEVYSKRSLATADALVELYDGTKQVFKSKRQSLTLGTDRTQQYIRVQLPANIAQGTYTLRVIGLDENIGKNYSESDYLFRSERSVVIERTLGGATVSDLDKAIRQLRYIASQTDIDTISAPTTPDERRAKFDSFWKSQDPTPNTARNEAFEEYYARIDYANKNFRSYNDGWLTDMGMVYVILGQPTQIDRRTNNFDGRGMVTWFYQNINRRFLFADNTGFGDYRLSPSTPFNFNEKYRYGM